MIHWICVKPICATYKRLPAGLALGGLVFVCDNLSFHGVIAISRKHTTGILRGLPGLVNHAVGQLSNICFDAHTHRFPKVGKQNSSKIT